MSNAISNAFSNANGIRNSMRSAIHERTNVRTHENGDLKTSKTYETARESVLEKLATFINENTGWSFTPAQVKELALSAKDASKLPWAGAHLQPELFNDLTRLRNLVIGRPEVVEQAAIELGLLPGEPDEDILGIVRASLAEAEAKFLQKLEGK